MINKAIIPVAGLGTRFLPATIAQPKEMLPLVDKPAIQFVVEEARASGIEDIILITGKNKRAIEDHFDPSPDLINLLGIKNKHDIIKQVNSVAEMGNLFYIKQNKPLGLGHAILQAERHMGGENFAVMLGDAIIDQKTPCMQEMMEIFNKYKKPVIAVEQVEKREISNYGIVKIIKNISNDLFELSDIIEKPKPNVAPSNWAVSARYILTPKIFNYLKKAQPTVNSEIQLTDSLANYIQCEGGAIAYAIKGKRLDIGSKLEYAKAFVKLGLRNKEIGEEFNRYIQSLKKH